MISRCIRCNRAFPKNSNIDGLPVGRRIAFDTEKGRLWVVCTHCEQWNLVPIEERWEAVEHCERLALSAEATATTTKVGIAQTESGLELLRVGGLSHVDIANWRYGRRLVKRQRMFGWIALALAVLAIVLGVRAGSTGGSALVGAYVTGMALVWFARILRTPPRLSIRAPIVGGKHLWVWPWQLGGIFIDQSDERTGPQVVIPGRHARRFAGAQAAQLLAGLLPRLNGAECAAASVSAAVKKVSDAEREERAHSKSINRKTRRHQRPLHEEAVNLRPWQRLALHWGDQTLNDISPENRLALEIAATEEIEQQHLTADAESAGEEWTEQDVIAGISDSLLMSPGVEDRFRELTKQSRHGEEPTTSPNPESASLPKRSNDS